MKKIIVLFALVSIGMMSCDKVRTCTCTTTSIDSNGSTSNSTFEYQVEDATKKEAEIACNGAKIINTYSDGSSDEQSCELSK